MKILVADDKEVDRMILQSIVSKEGYKVVTASDGVDTLDKFRKEKPDLILFGAPMPGMDGFAITKAIRREKEGALVPIIFLTPLTDSESLVNCLECGGDDFLSKPYNRQILMAKIGSQIRSHIAMKQYYETHYFKKKLTADIDVPKAFISYSHDSEEHKTWVEKLAGELQANGVNVFFDKWDVGPGDSLTLFMNRAISESKNILVVCTETYVEKANLGEGGVGYETQILSAPLMEKIDQNKCIPVIRSLSNLACVPSFLSGKLYCDFSKDENFKKESERILRVIHNVPAPENLRPPLGKNPFI